MTVADIEEWEKAHGPIPEGSVVFIRSDWSKRWPDPKLATEEKFPGVKLDALKFLHLQRHILFHGHEALDTDTTPDLEGEAWLLRNGYTQGEGICNLDQVPRDRRAGGDRLSEVRRRHGRVCALHRHLPAGLAARRDHRSGEGVTAAEDEQAAALGRQARDARQIGGGATGPVAAESASVHESLLSMRHHAATGLVPLQDPR